jgi:hypothetical protein
VVKGRAVIVGALAVDGLEAVVILTLSPLYELRADDPDETPVFFAAATRSLLGRLGVVKTVERSEEVRSTSPLYGLRVDDPDDTLVFFAAATRSPLGRLGVVKAVERSEEV